MRVLILVAIAGAPAACTPYDPSLPATPFFCNDTEPKCPDGYACVQPATGSAVCTTTSTTDGGPDGGPSGTCTMPFTGVLATWDLAGQPGTQTATAVTSNASGVTASAIARSAALATSSGTNSIAATGWPTASSLDPASYFTFGLAPPAGCILDVTAVAADVKSSATGPIHAALATSKDGFSQPTDVMTTAAGTVAISAVGATAMLELRLYGFAASATTGTMRVQNQLTITGALR